jgi:hypothetical protein
VVKDANLGGWRERVDEPTPDEAGTTGNENDRIVEVRGRRCVRFLL